MRNTAQKFDLDSGTDGQNPSALEKYRRFIQLEENLSLKDKKLLSFDLVGYLVSEFSKSGDKISVETARIADHHLNYDFMSTISGLLHNVIVELGYKFREFEEGQREESWGYETYSWGYDFKIIRTLTSIRLGNILTLERRLLTDQDRDNYISADREEKTPRFPDFRGKISPLELPKKVKLIDLLTSEFGLTAERAEQAYSALRSDFFVASKPSRKLLSLPEAGAAVPCYEGKSKSGDILEFLRKNFPHREGAPVLTMAYLREADTKAYQAFVNRKKRSDYLPEDVRLPTRGEINDALLTAHNVDLSSEEGRAEARKLMGVINGRMRIDN